MKKKAILAVGLILTAIFFSVGSYADSKDPVASLDGQPVTKVTLKNYVDNVAGSSYEPWLTDVQGLRKLADFYINRTLLLAYARQQVEKDATIVNNHSGRSVDEDIMYLTALLKTEVQEKATVTEDTIEAYLKEKQSISYRQAKTELESEKKRVLMEQLVNKVRSGHEIKYF
jgi:hypothetical protein